MGESDDRLSGLFKYVLLLTDIAPLISCFIVIMSLDHLDGTLGKLAVS